VGAAGGLVGWENADWPKAGWPKTDVGDVVGAPKAEGPPKAELLGPNADDGWPNTEGSALTSGSENCRFACSCACFTFMRASS
jgi:hypothetical protein